MALYTAIKTQSTNNHDVNQYSVSIDNSDSRVEVTGPGVRGGTNVTFEIDNGQ